MQTPVHSLSREQRGRCKHCTLWNYLRCVLFSNILCNDHCSFQRQKLKWSPSFLFQALGCSSPCRAWGLFSLWESFICLSFPLPCSSLPARGSFCRVGRRWASSVLLLLFHTLFRLPCPCSILLTEVLIPWKLCWRHQATLGDQLSSVSKPLCSNLVNGDRRTPSSRPGVHTSVTNNERESCGRIYQINTCFIWLAIPRLTLLELWFQR